MKIAGFHSAHWPEQFEAEVCIKNLPSNTHGNCPNSEVFLSMVDIHEVKFKLELLVMIVGSQHTADRSYWPPLLKRDGESSIEL